MKIPTGEKLLVTYRDGDRHYLITRTADCTGYVGYEIIGDKLKKLGKRKSPVEVEELFTQGKGESKDVKTRTKKMD